MTAKTESACVLGVAVALMVFPSGLLQWVPWTRRYDLCLYLLALAMTFGFWMSLVAAISLVQNRRGPWREVKKPPMTRIPISDAETYKALDKALGLPHFDGFPYLATYIVPTFYHVILLPSGLDIGEMTRIAVRQATVNRLQTCLVLGEHSCVYFGTNGSSTPSDCVPGCSFWASDKLLPGPVFIEDDELRGRKERLHAFATSSRLNGGWLMGDLTKGGRPATEEELARLAGFSANGVPKGLSQCGVCGGWRGECLDPNIEVFKDKMMKVYCHCQNDSLCARCGQPLDEYKLNANYYGEDGKIWHVPGFCGFQHRCPDMMKKEAYGGMEKNRA